MKNVPAATYRLQFNSTFSFRSARDIIPYLHDLGVSHVYASPVFKAVKGSVHGYDVVDPTEINPEIGSSPEFQKLITFLEKRSMGWVQDIVPNHMAFHGQNQWLMDVLEKGRASLYAHFFDIEWKDTYRNLKGKVLAPFLGRFYSQCLEDKEIQIHYKNGAFHVCYFDLELPLYVRTYGDILLFRLEDLKERVGNKIAVYRRYRDLSRRFGRSQGKDKVAYRHKVSELKTQLHRLYCTNKDVRAFIDQNVRHFNGKKGNAQSFDPLDQMLSKQLFRLSFWKFGSEEINYRRFFNINQLISLKVEEKKVFEYTHRFILELLRRPAVSGLRIDHIDGLYDPKAYLKRLRRALPGKYIIVEKILEGGEQLPRSWPVQGTTGYDFINHLNRIFIARHNEDAFTKIYESFTQPCSLEELIPAKKRLIIGKHMAGDIDNLAHHMKRISHKDRYGRDITSYGLKRALVEVLSYFPRYRTYVDSEDVSDEDRSVIKETISRAKEANPGLVYELDFIADILLLNFKGALTGAERRHWLHFVKRFQQFTGPLMAKGFEDTTLYIYNRLLSLNEVGGSPEMFGSSIKEFHRVNAVRSKTWPHTMNAGSTHDTKRGEDARARLNVLSEIPAQWGRKVKQWQRMNRNKKSTLSDRAAPDANDEYFLYQSMLGAFPLEGPLLKDFDKRLKDYAIKAIREAKVHTAWIQPDERYEQATLEFIDRLMDHASGNPFYKDFLVFKDKVAEYGIYNSLSQALVKLTSPGVPDLYQGSELWDLSFVDPDNRRPVDYKQRAVLLNEMKEHHDQDPVSLLKELLKNKRDGRIKLFLTWKALRWRRDHYDLYLEGKYIPLKTGGAFKDHVIAFARRRKRDCAITVVPRFLTSVVSPTRLPLGKAWKDTSVVLPASLKARSWRDVLSGRELEPGGNLPVRTVFTELPVALLTSKGRS